MKYTVMHRGHPVLMTNDLPKARAKLEALGDTAYINYSAEGIKTYEATHSPILGEIE